MDSLFLANLTSPPLLFFALGLLAALVRSDLEIPEQVAKLLSLYLLFAIGFKGGVALSSSLGGWTTFTSLGAAVLLASLIPFGVFFALRARLGAADAAAMAATYGSVSAVTFVTATSFLDAGEVTWSGYMVAAMALMESPAIIIGLLLYRVYNRDSAGALPFEPKAMLRESLLNGSVFLILGSLAIGYATGERGMTQLEPLVVDLFIGILCLFLLDMGIVAMRRMRDLSRGGGQTMMLALLGLLLPLLHGAMGMALAWMLGLGEGDALLLVVLAASASYIAVPAAMRLALPEANPSYYLGTSLAITFPFNLIVGIPLYHVAVRWLVA